MSNLEIAKLYRRISILENINNVTNMNDQYTYKIDDFGITSLNHIVIDKNYYYIKPTVPIHINFSGYLIAYKEANLTFIFNIFDDNNDMLYSIDKNIDLYGDFNFDIPINIMKELLNVNIQFIILGQNNLFKPNQMYMNDYYFKNCTVYIRFNV